MFWYTAGRFDSLVLGGTVVDFFSFKRDVDVVKKVKKNGVEYWMARDLQRILGYTTWERFEGLIDRAQAACDTIGEVPGNHFRNTAKAIPSGKGAQLQKKDYFLSRLACYLIAMNGDPTKRPEIALAQTYFAVQARRSEVRDEANLDVVRFEKRQSVKEHNKMLSGVAKNSGVLPGRFGIFQDFGYLGLYGMGAKAIRAKKGIPEKDNHLDYANIAELAANDLRITLAAARLSQLGVHNEGQANQVHEQIGRNVRTAIVTSGHATPENLPAEPHIKTIEKKLKEQRKKEDATPLLKD